MKIILSPAKKMKETEDFEWKKLPVFLNQAERLKNHLQNMSVDELACVMKCNMKIAQLNYSRYQNMNLKEGLVPALFAYEGLQYQHMAPHVFTDEELAYVEKHVVILSGFYGLLYPFDGICPYRLEMQTKLDINEHKSLYEFWNDKIAKELYHDDNIVLNLASKEYAHVIEPYINDRDMITCIFAEKANHKLKTKGTEAKMLRGEMVRYMAVHQIEDLEEIKDFHFMGYTYDPTYSTEVEWFFVKSVD